jgi:hypothetical protein
LWCILPLGQMEQITIRASRAEIERLIVAAQTQAAQAQQPVTRQEPFPAPDTVAHLMPGGSNGYESTIP